MAIFPGTSITPAGAAGGYTIDQSLKFVKASNTYLYKTPSSAGNRRTFTYSVWFKKVENVVGDYYPNLLNARSGGTYTFFNIKTGTDIITLNEDFNVKTAGAFRDYSAWYHIVLKVDTTQSTSTDRVKIYVNGVESAYDASSTWPSLNQQLQFNNTIQHRIGSQNAGDPMHINGYMANAYLIDGQALGPEYFGEVDATYGHWKPIEYTGTYGTNGFFFDFSNASNFGEDQSGNGNNWTSTGFTSRHQVLDSPTNNFCTLNPLDERNQWNAVPTADYSGTFAEGNLKWTSPSCTSYSHNSTGTFWVDSGKWYWEGYMVSDSGGQASFQMASAVNGSSYDKFYTGNISAGTTVGIKVDLDSNSIQYTTDGTNYSNMTAGGGNTYSLGAVPLTPMFQLCSSVAVANFGQDSSFAGNKTAQNNTDANGYGDFYYSPPSGFLALCTANLSDPAVVPGENFNTVTWAGNGTTDRDIPVGFNSDFVWIKQRSSGTEHHQLFDLIRGANARLCSSGTFAEDATNTERLKAFITNGFTIGNDIAVNNSGSTYAAWNWKADNTSGSSNTDGSITSTVAANVDAGFSIVSYTGTGSSGTIGHGLSSAPELVIYKNRSSALAWFVQGGPSVFSTVSPTPAYNFRLLLNGDYALSYDTGHFTANPTSSVLSVGSYSYTNQSGSNHIAYCFHSVDGYSKFGSYASNSDTNGPFIYTGFRPAMVIVKRSTDVQDWVIYDNKRDVDNEVRQRLFPNTSGAESDYNGMDFLSNGFKIRINSSQLNYNATYIYMAFAEYPFKFSTAR